MKTLDQNQRRYDIDWIRIALIFSVFLFHIGMFFNGFGWHIKNNEQIQWLNPVMAWLHRWRMPLLFMVSGVGTYFALGKRSMGGFIGERARRLLIPLVFGMFVIVPPQVWAEKQAQYGSFLNFIPHLAEGSYPEGNLSWHHLWFVLYLFICALTAIPVILIFRSRLKEKIYTFLEGLFAHKGALLLLVFPLYLSQEILQDYFPEETHALVDDWAYFAYSFLFFIYGYILLSGKKIISEIVRQRSFYAGISLVLTGIFFFDYYISIDPWVPNSIQLILGSLLDFSIALCILGYGARYINRDSPWRKPLNEAIYPFYILHQTAIIVIGLYLMNLSLPVFVKAIILTGSSFLVSAGLYWFVIRRFYLTRLVFGLKPKITKSDPHKSIKLLKQAS